MCKAELEKYGVVSEMKQFYDGETMTYSEPKKIYFIGGKRVTIFDANAHILRQQVQATREREAQLLAEMGF